MGTDITVMLVDWGRVTAVPAAERLSLLNDAALDDIDWLPVPGTGLLLPPQGADWRIGFDFRGTMSLYKAHFWAVERWDKVRRYFPGWPLRAALDDFMGRLDLLYDFYGLPENTDGARLLGTDPEAPPDLLTACSPDSAVVAAGLWRRVSPRLEELRPCFDRHAAEPGRWSGTFEEWTDLLSQWGEATAEAQRRAWGIIGVR
ncbi:hypothetical protein AB0399_29260 [Streptomyces sp. NPDC088194]|uniref:hypothetical protein n=1 Tax=Streptomyces sp. NPDC088194 TaxID=3154931 RepID=UPI00344BEE86